MLDPHLETLLREIVTLQLFTIGMIAVAVVVSMSVLLSGAIAPAYFPNDRAYRPNDGDIAHPQVLREIREQ